MSGMNWNMLHPQMTPDRLGYIPDFLDDQDPRSAKEQFNQNYISGWDPMPGFQMDEECVLSYPGDPSLKPLALLEFRDELILFYNHSWVAIVQPDGSFEVCRMD